MIFKEEFHRTCLKIQSVLCTCRNSSCWFQYSFRSLVHPGQLKRAELREDQGGSSDEERQPQTSITRVTLGQFVVDWLHNIHV